MISAELPFYSLEVYGGHVANFWLLLQVNNLKGSAGLNTAAT